jgi:hypothetical protein
MRRARPDQEPTPAERAESELRWRARYTGLSQRGIEERAKQLVQLDSDPDPFRPIEKGGAVKRRPSPSPRKI